MLNTPVLFIVFNRPETTKQVFEVIRKAKPKQLFVAADGPRSGKEGEKERCQEVREIATNVDWECEVKTMFREKNMGCGKGPSEAITWFFENVEQGIILEDDCLADPSFFNFCEQLLIHYAEDERIMHISGNNFQYGKLIGDGSYYFSIYTHNWGWATWRRAWKKYEFELHDVENFFQSDEFEKILKRKVERDFWRKELSELKMGKYDVWDGQWLYAVWKNKGFSILPNFNLITNIGFGENATHTFNNTSSLANIPVKPISTLKHPSSIKINLKADQRNFDNVFLLKQKKNLLKRLVNRIIKK